MNHIVVLRLIARAEYDDAVAWYESERAGLGIEFTSAVNEVLERIVQNPLAFRAVHGPIRRAIVKRFPYTVHFLPESGRIVVIAIFHGSRDPRQLADRNQ